MSLLVWFMVSSAADLEKYTLENAYLSLFVGIAGDRPSDIQSSKLGG
jgi:hypothetical protein